MAIYPADIIGRIQMIIGKFRNLLNNLGDSIKIVFYYNDQEH